MRYRAILVSWLAASLCAGVISTAEGNVENLVGDGSLLGAFDATAGWLVFTSPIFALGILMFLPMAAYLEAQEANSVLVFSLAGLVAGLLMAAFLGGFHFSLHSLFITGVPGLVGGAAWGLASDRQQHINTAPR